MNAPGCGANPPYLISISSVVVRIYSIAPVDANAKPM